MINILIRTSDRPIFFKKCIESILNQKHGKLNLIVSADTAQSVKYASDILGMETIGTDVTFEIMPMKKGNMKYFYNAYLNKMIERVKTGWIWCVDDDDELAGGALSRLETEIIQPCATRINMFIFQMCRAAGNQNIIKPWGMPYQNFHPVLGQIGMPCFLLHHSLKDKVKFTAKEDSDFRYIRDVMQHANYRVINEVMVNVSPRGFGRPEPKKKV